MKKPEDYGSIMGLNEEQYNALIEKIKLVQKDAYLSGQVNILNSFHTLANKINDKIYNK